MYNLVGISIAVSPIILDNQQLKAKVTNSYMINVKNWLKDTQRFDVEIRMENKDSSIFINGANTIDIAGNDLKEYKITLFSLKANNNHLLVTFKNPITYEFISYKTNTIFTAPDVLTVLEMSSVVRESTSKLVTLENPLSTPVIIKPDYFITDNENLSFNPKSFTIPAKSVFIILYYF